MRGNVFWRAEDESQGMVSGPWICTVSSSASKPSKIGSSPVDWFHCRYRRKERQTRCMHEISKVYVGWVIRATI